MNEQLIGLQILLDFLHLLIWSGQLDDERPVSAIIVGAAGGGKTSMLELIECEQALFVGDLTARNLGVICKNEKLTHVLLGDMLSLFGHKSSTVDLTIRLISQLTGERMKQNPFSGEEIKGVQLGLITAIPPEDMQRSKVKQHITSGGFASRFLIIKYGYKTSTVQEIHDFIKQNGYAQKKPLPFTIKIPAKLRVVIPPKIADSIATFALLIKEQNDLGFRAHRHLRALVKAAARREGLKEANERHLALIKNYTEFFTKGKEL